MRNVILASLMIAPFASSCFVVGAAAGAAGVVVYQKKNNKSFVSTVNMDVAKAWPIIKSSLAEISPDLVDVDEEKRVAQATYGGSKVVISAEAYDLDQTTIIVSADRYAMPDGNTAGVVMDKIMDRLKKAAP